MPVNGLKPNTMHPGPVVWAQLFPGRFPTPLRKGKEVGRAVYWVRHHLTWPEHVTDTGMVGSPSGLLSQLIRLSSPLHLGQRGACLAIHAPCWWITSRSWGSHYLHIHLPLLVPDNGWNLIICQRTPEKENLRTLACYTQCKNDCEDPEWSFVVRLNVSRAVWLLIYF